MKANNANFIAEGRKLGSLGNWLTNWGDMGHMNLLGLLAYPLVYASEHMWSEEPAEEKAILEAFSWTFFKDPVGDSARQVEALQRVNTVMQGMAVFGGIGFLAFFDEPL